jgi:hypothetical protein
MQNSGIAAADRLMGQNIDEYYKGVVKEIISELAGSWGDNFYFNERFIGQVFDSSAIINRLIDNCNKYILNSPRFMEPFVNELLHRANVVSEYENKEVLTQEELFNNLFALLEKNAKVSIYIINFAARHRYEEKYFFGNYMSPFIQYAFKVDGSSRTYKLGCVNENKASSIQKLNLMGGFTIDSVVYAKNCFKYYTIFKNEGFKLHGIDEGKLPAFEFRIT